MGLLSDLFLKDHDCLHRDNSHVRSPDGSLGACTKCGCLGCTCQSDD